MAPSIAQQRAAIQKQALSVSPPAVRRDLQWGDSSFFTAPLSSVMESAADCDALPKEQLEALIQEAAHQSGVDTNLVRAVIEQESGGRPCALSAKGAQGLMQLMPDTAEQFDVEDAFDPKRNVEAGTRLLKTLLARYNNDPTLALGAYNAGPTRVDQQGGVPQIPETMDYVTAILDKLHLLPSATTSMEPVAPAAKNSGWQIAPTNLKDF
jgi:soluble lytic murein transglycosylase-like protein